LAIEPQQGGGQQNAGQQGSMQGSGAERPAREVCGVKGIALRACAPEKGRAEFLLMGIIIKTGRGRETGKEISE
jgi:hypothetical protein